MAKINGATLIARSLKEQGIDHLFGVVGFPVGPIAEAAQKKASIMLGCVTSKQLPMLLRHMAI